jgi:hypothetical protein
MMLMRHKKLSSETKPAAQTVIPKTCERMKNRQEGHAQGPENIIGLNYADNQKTMTFTYLFRAAQRLSISSKMDVEKIERGGN